LDASHLCEGVGFTQSRLRIIEYNHTGCGRLPANDLPCVAGSIICAELLLTIL